MSVVVGDDDQLYRRIQERAGEQFCFQVVDGRTVFLHAAFNDPKKRPSVDRAVPRGDLTSAERASEGIVSLQAGFVGSALSQR